MDEPMISILIRHKEGREEMLQRCLESIWSQTYKNIKILISLEIDNDFFVHSICPESNVLMVPKQHYNLHMNILKSEVEKGWFLPVDDDDSLAGPNVLQDLSNIIVNNYPWKGAYIGRFLRNGRPKPPMNMMRQGIIQKGFVGGGCAVVHHIYKDSANWQGIQAADFQWLRDMQIAGVPMKFIDLILQRTFNNGLHGK